MGGHDGAKPELGTSVKLRMFSSPLVKKERDGHHYISPTAAEREGSPAGDDHKSDDEDGEEEDYPVLRRHEEPTLLEIFYDLFFAATYNAFCDVKQVTSGETFKASIGYFCLLWLTWLAVTLFEVRYATDSIFSRVATAVQLGVLIGFVVVAPGFDPSSPTQDHSVMKSMSFILTVSRVALVVQYSWILAHLRKHKESILPLALQTGMHAVAAIVYLGVAFAFRDDTRNRVYMTWYFISGIEALGTLAIGTMTQTVAFVDTHLMKRTALLTVMILGEGIESMAKKVIVIVKNSPHAWDNTTKGQLTAAAATVYFVFLVYFDWLGHSFNLPKNRQAIWMFLHLPFHLALVLFMQGFIQLLIWGKIASSINKVLDLTDGSELFDDDQTMTSASIAKAMNDTAFGILDEYPAKTARTIDAINESVTNVTRIPDSFWNDFTDWVNDHPTSNYDNLPDALQTQFLSFLMALYGVASTLSNSIFSAFGIDLEGEISHGKKGIDDGGKKVVGKSSEFQFEVQAENWDRYALVFAYTYISAGCAIILLLILKSIASAPPKSAWAYARIFIITLLGLGTALVSLLWYSNPNGPISGGFLDSYLSSPWVGPTICVVWTILVVITHVNMGPFRMGIGMFRQKKAERAERAERRRLASRLSEA